MPSGILKNYPAIHAVIMALLLHYGMLPTISLIFRRVDSDTPVPVLASQ